MSVFTRWMYSHAWIWPSMETRPQPPSAAMGSRIWGLRATASSSCESSKSIRMLSASRTSQTEP
eukprot:10424481-Alexandrium_andersonii.AAC.1